MIDKWIIWGMFVVIVVYNILDSLHTVAAIQIGIHEANPILAYFIDVFNTVHIIWWIKATPLALLGISLYMWLRQSASS